MSRRTRRIHRRKRRTRRNSARSRAFAGGTPNGDDTYIHICACPAEYGFHHPACGRSFLARGFSPCQWQAAWHGFWFVWSSSCSAIEVCAVHRQRNTAVPRRKARSNSSSSFVPTDSSDSSCSPGSAAGHGVAIGSGASAQQLITPVGCKVVLKNMRRETDPIEPVTREHCKALVLKNIFAR